MNDMNPFDLPPLDDNAPPVELGELPSVDEIIAYLEVNYSEVTARTREIVEKGAKYFVIRNDAEDSAATEFMASVRANWKTGEAGRVKEKDPYYIRDGAVHAWFRTHIIDPAGEVGKSIQAAQTTFKKAKMEAERKVREEEARLAREAEDKRRLETAKLEQEAREAEQAAARKRNADVAAKAMAEAAEKRRQADEARAAENKAAAERAEAEAAANAKAADLTRARGDRGGVSSLKEFLNVRDISRETIDLEMLRPYLDDKALEKAVRAYADANKATVQNHLRNSTQPIKGVFFFIDHRTGGRA